MRNARIDRCVYGAADPKGGALGTLYDVSADPRLNHAFPVASGILEDECAAELRSFVRRLRGAHREKGAEGPHDVSSLEALEVALGGDCGKTPTPTPMKASAAVCRPPMRSHRPTAPARQGGMRGPRNVVLALASFQGCAPSSQIERWLAEGIRRAGDDVRVAEIDLAPARAALAGVRLVALSDVKSPLVGPRGAARMFGPQKGLGVGLSEAERDEVLAACDGWMAAYGARLTAARDALDVSADPRLNHAFPVASGILEDECAAELRSFFRRLRGARREEGAEGPHDVSRLEALEGALGGDCGKTPTPTPMKASAAVCRPPMRSHRPTAPARKGGMRGPLNVVLAIDSFKGCATSSQIEMWLAEGMRRGGDDVRVAEIPVADGGEGTVEALRRPLRAWRPWRALWAAIAGKRPRRPR